MLAAITLLLVVLVFDAAALLAVDAALLVVVKTGTARGDTIGGMVAILFTVAGAVAVLVVAVLVLIMCVVLSSVAAPVLPMGSSVTATTGAVKPGTTLVLFVGVALLVVLFAVIAILFVSVLIAAKLLLLLSTVLLPAVEFAAAVGSVVGGVGTTASTTTGTVTDAGCGTVSAAAADDAGSALAVLTTVRTVSPLTAGAVAPSL